MPTRRSFLQRTAGTTASLLAAELLPGSAPGQGNSPAIPPFPAIAQEAAIEPLSLSPARWIWIPSRRTLPNTFALFRRTFTLPAEPVRATGYLSADSRYLLSVNGSRLQFGPAPCDPRYLEADPFDCTSLLRKGGNTIGATVLFYALGDGTSPLGKPGFILLLTIECADGSRTTIATGPDWEGTIGRGWKAGSYKRWYVRSLQEQFDARRHPYGWDTPGYQPGKEWTSPLILDLPPDKPPLCSRYVDHLYDISARQSECTLRKRAIPPVTESIVHPSRLAEAHRFTWTQAPDEYFDFDIPGAWESTPLPLPAPNPDGSVSIRVPHDESIGLTFEFAEEIVGFPFFTIHAPAGTTVELLVQEGHDPSGPALLNTHFHAWIRFTCREGENRFTCFDYEAVKWLQIHLRNGEGPIRISGVGVLRRLYPWPHTPSISTSDPVLNSLLRASVNTLNNSAQETIVDGMGRERQQYSGDGSHQLHGIACAFGDTKLHNRFVSTFSQGVTLDGYFLDCWPAYDRLARVMERQLGLTPWGPILDHSVGFVFDCWFYHLYSGEIGAIREAYPRLQRFVSYLRRIQSPDTGLLPVENLGLPSVWMDHEAYLRNHQHHKECAFNLYAAAMLGEAFPRVADLFGDSAWRERASEFSAELLHAARKRFWDPDRELFVVNRPWLGTEKHPRLCDRSTATAVLFDQCPDGRIGPSIDALSSLPPEMGVSYPANAGWRLAALVHGRKADTVLSDLRNRWGKMASIIPNNTLAENWVPAPDSGDLWSHCPVAPLFIIAMGIGGIRPLSPGWRKILVAPQPGELESIDVRIHTPFGPVRLEAHGSLGDRRLSVTSPAGAETILALDQGETGIPYPHSPSPLPGTNGFVLPAGKVSTLTLRRT